MRAGPSEPCRLEPRAWRGEPAEEVVDEPAELEQVADDGQAADCGEDACQAARRPSKALFGSTEGDAVRARNDLQWPSTPTSTPSNGIFGAACSRNAVAVADDEVDPLGRKAPR
jgi:hypothetical protein